MSGTLAIIGTAGRNEDAPRITRALYDAMYAQTLEAISDWGCRAAVSGGAAVADHLAVRAFLEGAVDGLKLYLPARFDGRRYIPNPSVPSNPGQTANQYHEAFSQTCGIDSLAEIAAAIRKGAKTEVHEGFKRRNLEVANACTHMLALTFGNMTPPRDIPPAEGSLMDRRAADLKDGGTAFHGSGVDHRNRRKVYQDFLPTDPGFTDSRIALLRDGGTSHTWNEAWKPVIKRHIHLGLLKASLVP